MTGLLILALILIVAYGCLVAAFYRSLRKPVIYEAFGVQMKRRRGKWVLVRE